MKIQENNSNQSSWQKEFNIFWIALTFYTRLPSPCPIQWSGQAMRSSLRYFPLVGLIVGCFSAVIFSIAHSFFPVELAVILSMVASLLITGAFHEDGFADACDGFGGGVTKEQVLTIMKDSRLGTYGVIGLVMMLLSKWACLIHTPLAMIPWTLIVAHSVSRLAVVLCLRKVPYIREDAQAKAKIFAEKLEKRDIIIASASGLIPLFLICGWQSFWLLLMLFVVTEVAGHYFQKRLGGVTGDCLGALQQICELTCYMSFLLLWTFI